MTAAALAPSLGAAASAPPADRARRFPHGHKAPLAAADLFMGSFCLYMTAIAVVAWLRHEASWRTPAAIFAYVLSNFLVSRLLTSRAREPARGEIIRVVVMTLANPLVYLMTDGPMALWWPGFLINALGQGIVLGLITQRASWGMVLAAYYIALYALCTALGVRAPNWYDFALHAGVIAMASLLWAKIMSLLGKALEGEHDRSRKLEAALNALEQAHESLHAAQAQVVQAEKMASLGKLVAGVAHEINTPIGAICSTHGVMATALDKLRHAPVAGHEQRRLRTIRAIDESLDIIGTASTRVAELVRRLRLFARLDEAERKTADIHAGLEDTLLLIRHELGQNVRVVKRFGYVPPILCYPSQLNQLFLNLLVNAAHAVGSEGGQIEITTDAARDWVRVAVRDDGCGIEPSNLKRIFDPGFTTKGAGVGSGLGLAICYQIIRAHGGEISVESAPGEGACFTVVLPTNWRSEPAARAKV